MTNEEKCERLSEIFEKPGLTPETSLGDVAWDSMAMLSVIALAKTVGRKVQMAELLQSKTVGDLLGFF